MKLTYRMIDGILSAVLRFEADDPGDFEEAQERSNEAVSWAKDVRAIVRRGGVVLVLTRAEMRELKAAFANTVAEPSYFKGSKPRTRRALLSVAEKLGEVIAR